MNLKPRVKITGDGRFKPLLTYSDGPKRYGAATTQSIAFKRAKRAFDSWRFRVLVVKGMIKEHDDHMTKYERRRPLRVIFA